MIKYEILRTGSSGNCVYLGNGILLDCGVPFKEVEPYLNQIKLVFISHEHKDHMNLITILKLHKLRPTIRFAVGFWLKEKLLEVGIPESSIDSLEQGKVYDYKLFKVMVDVLFHDVKNFAIRIFDAFTKNRILYAVDTARIDHIKAKNYDLYLIEANYDADLLKRNIWEDLEVGKFSYCLRVKDTHLSIQQAKKFIKASASKDSKCEFLHASKRNL